MEEIQPGLLHWTAYRDTIGADVHSYLHVPSGTALDPMEPLNGLDALPNVERVVLTNRHHYRHSDRFRERFGCPVLCHEAGLHEFDGGVDGFAWGAELAPGVTAHEVGVLCPEETAVHVGDALAFADAIVRGRHGELGFVPDFLLGDDPAAIRQGLRERFRALAETVEFDALLLAHGDPLAAGGRSALRTFADAPTAGAPPG
jgi:glyoxylase-like metal-dependent hydrolase (beta-lactamase superfamily II)